MKTKKNIMISVLLLLLLFGATNIGATTKTVQTDSSVIAFSLFYEAFRTKDFNFAYEKGWPVINKYVEKFLQYKPFDKMDKVITHMHDSVATTDEERQKYADELLILFDKAIETPNVKSPENFIIRKPYIIEIWTDAPVEEKISAYLEAFGKLETVNSFYRNRLGQLYEKNISDENDYKLKAIDVYSELAELEPENDLWNQILIRIIGDNPEELADVRKRSWDLDREDTGKAYAYAETCIRFQFFERAVEPLVFLTQKSPEVINYWRKLATVYTRLDQNDNSINAYKTLIELEPENRENYYNLALIYKNLEQLSVSRSYLQKGSNASEEPWDLPVYLEAQLYEQAARDCGFEFEDRLVYLLAVNTYRKAANIGGPNSAAARERINALSSSVPQQEDYFFRKLTSGTVLKIEGRCYGWINRTVTVP